MTFEEWWEACNSRSGFDYSYKKIAELAFNAGYETGLEAGGDAPRELTLWEKLHGEY